MIPFNDPSIVDHEYNYIDQVFASPHWSGDGPFTKRCQEHILKQLPGAKSVLLTHSCTAALEMCALACNLYPGAEVIMPSWTMTSTANAVALRLATPVFVDVEPGTLNIDPRQIERAITDKTAAIFVTHYAGVPCDMDEINTIAEKHGLFVIEDAAQAYLSTYNGRPAGTLGHAAAISFHATKNVISGEGGAFVTTLKRFARQAEIFREKGTDRSRMLRGEIDKYSWVDIGSSYLPSEIVAAVLLAQLEYDSDLTLQRLAVWHTYDSFFLDLDHKGGFTRCRVPLNSNSNGHIYFIILDDPALRDKVIAAAYANGVQLSAHYQPLHNSRMGLVAARTHGPDNLPTRLPVTEHAAAGIIRFPMRIAVSDAVRVCETVKTALLSQ